MDPLYISSEQKIKYEAIETTNVKVEIKAEPDIDFEYNEINFDGIEQKPLIKTEKLDLEDVIYGDDDDTERFLCEQCGFVSSSALLFTQHTTHHVKPTEKKFKCALDCPFETFYKADLNKHISEKHLVDIESLKKCPPLVERILKFLKDKWVMMTHKKPLRKAVESPIKFSNTKQDQKLWFCGGRCPFKIQNVDALIKHVQLQHKWVISSKNMRVKRKQERMQQLKGRKKTVNLNAKGIVYRCSKCNDYKHSSRKKVVAHMLRSHYPVRPQKRVQKVRHKKRPSHPVLPKKVTEMTTVTSYKCGTCSFKANTEEFVKSHFRSFHFCDKK